MDHRRRRRATSASWPPSLARRLTERFAPGGARPPRPGQVVPGRAAARAGRSAIIWRADGEPLWRDPTCSPTLADGPATPTAGRERSRTVDRRPPRRRPPTFVLPAYEDPLAELLERGTPARRRRRLTRSTPTDAAERRRRARRADRELDARRRRAGRLGAPAAPRRTATAGRPSRWRLRRGRLVPVAGDVAAGPAPAAATRSPGSPGAGSRRSAPPFDASVPPAGRPMACAADRNRPPSVPIDEAPPTALASRPATATSTCSCRR